MISEGGVMLMEMEKQRDAVRRFLSGYFDDEKNNGTSYATLLESMRYSLMAGGKYIRAIICLKFCEAVCGSAAKALDAACAIEMLHTYSLIHDDLPCMDDDDMRRGQPSNHMKFGEFTATLAGDALQAAAFETLLRSGLPPETVVRIALVLTEAAGPHGICAGQYLDLSSEGRNLTMDEILEIHSMKTSSLISASAQIGVIAGGGTERQIKAADGYARAVGLAFQIRDDILDCTSTLEELGKPIGSDRENKKNTFVSLLGIEECEKLIRSETGKAITALEENFGDASFLIWLANHLAERRN